jgi:hypothetical protein
MNTNNIYRQDGFSTALDAIYQTSHKNIPITLDGKQHSLPIFEKNKELLVGILFEKTGLSTYMEDNLNTVMPQIVSYAEENDFKNLRVFSRQEMIGLSNHAPGKVNMILPLPKDADVIWKGIKGTMRNRVRRPKREGYHHTIRHHVDDLEIFYAIYCQSIHNLGSLTLPFSFFKDIFSRFKDDTYIQVGYLNEKPVCTAFLTDCGDEMFMPWAGSITEYNRFGVNMAMYWNMIEWSIEQGKSALNLGRSTRGEGTYRFKKQWLAEARSLYMYNIPIYQESEIKTKIYSHISSSIKKSPEFVMDCASKLFVKRFY